MLDTVSCWYVDWAAIGAWVGGLGSAGAAICALWIARRDSTRRRNYAKFLFRRDIDKLILLQGLLEQSALAMAELEIHRGEHPDETEMRVIRDRGFRALSTLSSELEYLGRSDMLFEYNPESEQFANLHKAVREVQGIPDLVHITVDRFDGVIAANEMRTSVGKLARALEPYASLRTIAIRDDPAMIASPEPA